MGTNHNSVDLFKCNQQKTKSDNDDILLDIYREALGHAPESEDDKSKCRAASRVLAWLGMATLDKTKRFGCEPGYLLKLYGADWLKGQRES